MGGRASAPQPAMEPEQVSSGNSSDSSEHEYNPDESSRGRRLPKSVEVARSPPVVLDTNWTENFLDDAINRVEGNGINGLFNTRGGNCIIPEEVMELILSYCAADDLLNVAAVCVRWKTITTSRSFWSLVCSRHNVCLANIPLHIQDNPNAWIAFYAFCRHNILTRNFVVNPSGAEGFRGWRLSPPENHGQAFQIEEIPVGLEMLPDDPDFDSPSCFVSSYTFATKVQIINLASVGLTRAVMTLCVPFEFCLSDMIGARFDCGGLGDTRLACFETRSYDQNAVVVKKENFDIPAGGGWKYNQVLLTVDTEAIQKYDVRYINVFHTGKDSRFWAGYYGPKFTRSCLKIRLIDRETETSGTDNRRSKTST